MTRDSYQCRSCRAVFRTQRPRHCGEWRSIPRQDPCTGVWDPEAGDVVGGDALPSCPVCGHVYIRRLSAAGGSSS